MTIEPHTEDDWEVLELNAEVAEASILSQVNFYLHAVFYVSFEGQGKENWGEIVL